MFARELGRGICCESPLSKSEVCFGRLLMIQKILSIPSRVDSDRFSHDGSLQPGSTELDPGHRNNESPSYPPIFLQ